MSPRVKPTTTPAGEPAGNPGGKRTQGGSVAFVGAGPGDPGLLTVRAIELLGAADVVVLDALTREQVLGHCRADAEVVEGTLGVDGESLSQATRIKRVIEPAKAGLSVVRVIDGDPAVDGGSGGRFVAEVSACAKAHIRFEIVPGVPRATGVPIYAGLPLVTDRVREVRVVDVRGLPADWSLLAAGDATLVLLGGYESLGEMARDLVAAGRKPTTPVVVTRSGTTTDQRTVVTTLERVVADLKAAKFPAEAGRDTVVVVGEVAHHREVVSWFETKPLFGWRVLVPRTKQQAGPLSGRLRAYGAVPSEVPTISVEPPRTPQQMERAVKGLVTGRYEWVAFTSTNAVKAVRERFEEYGLDARAFSGIKVAAVGEQTSKALTDWGIKPDLVPTGEQSAAGLLDDWPPYDPVFDPIDRVFLPRADIATETLVAGLVDLGWQVDDVTAYRTVRAAPPPAETREAIKTGRFDAVLFTSSSTVRNLVGIAGKPHSSTVIACIGPQTAKTAEEHGLRVDVMAPEPAVAELADALAEYGVSRRLAALEAGEPVARPSERRSAARRKAK